MRRFSATVVVATRGGLPAPTTHTEVRFIAPAAVPPGCGPAALCCAGVGRHAHRQTRRKGSSDFLRVFLRRPLLPSPSVRPTFIIRPASLQRPELTWMLSISSMPAAPLSLVGAGLTHSWLPNRRRSRLVALYLLRTSLVRWAPAVEHFMRSQIPMTTRILCSIRRTPQAEDLVKGADQMHELVHSASYIPAAGSSNRRSRRHHHRAGDTDAALGRV